MDARAFLAIVLLLWLIRTWVKWDLQAKDATQSRLRLRDRLADSMLRERVGARPATLNDTDIVSDSSDTESPVSDDNNSVATDRIQQLKIQLATLEAQAKASNQSDLEIRRLRSELESVQSGNADISALEARFRIQQEALTQGAENPRPSVPAESFGKKEPSPGTSPESSQQKPATSAAVESDDKSIDNATRTPLFEAPPEKDDLKLINGIGPVMERTLNDLGVTTFRQLANFNQADIDKVSEAIGAFSGRIERDDWVGKARKLVNDKSSA